MGCTTHAPATVHDVAFSLRPAPVWSMSIDKVLFPWRSLQPSPKPVGIPFEIILSILQLAATSSDGLHDVSTLLSCSLVCRAWSYPAQHLLFSDVILHRRSQFDALYSAFHSTPALHGAVRKLRVSVDPKQPDMITPDNLASVLALCGNITHLDLAVYDPPPTVKELPPLKARFTPEIFSRLATASSITSLNVANWSSHRYLLEDLLCVWPSVSSLSVSGYADSFRHTSCSISTPLQGLSINIKPAPSIEFIQWLLHSSSSSLRSLDFVRTPSSDILEFITDNFSASLTALSLPSCFLHDHVVAIQKCTNLRAFKIESPSTCPFPVWKYLPSSTLHSISLGINKETSLQSAVDLIRQSARLQSVSVYLWDGALQNPQWARLKMACALAGVTLHSTDHIRAFRSSRPICNL